jgi:hypothetical protein
MADDDTKRLKLQLLKLINDKGAAGAYKYNLTGRDAPGELELSLGQHWTTEQGRDGTDV